MNGRNAITACLMLLPLAGCAKHEARDQLQRGQPRPLRHPHADRASVDAMGGLDELYNSVFRVVATVTIYDDAQGAVPGTAPATQPAPSGAVVWHTAMTIDPVGQTIEAKAPTGTGGWQAVLRNGRCDFRGQGQLVPPRQQQAICEMLNIALHRVSGPLNFVVAGEQARSLSHSVVDGEHVLRVGVSSSDAEIRAYYFNPRSGAASIRHRPLRRGQPARNDHRLPVAEAAQRAHVPAEHHRLQDRRERADRPRKGAPGRFRPRTNKRGCTQP